MKKRMIALAAAALLLVGLMPAASADFDVSTRESVVVVATYLDTQNYGEAGFGWGTGFFVGKQGEDPSYLVTNYHVIEDYVDFGSGELIEVALSDTVTDTARCKVRAYYDSSTYDEAYIVEYNASMDVAILRLDNPTSQRKPIALCSPTDSMVGSTVYAVGYPGLSENMFAESTSKWGLSDMTVTSGSVSRLLTTSGTGQRNIQIDCDIKHGNSGGPLVNADGAAIGITTWSVTNSGNQESVNYAVNIDEAITLLNRNGVAYETAGAAAQPSEDPGATQPDKSEEPTTTPEPATPPAAEPEAKSNTLLIAGGAAVVVVLAAVVLLSKKKKSAPISQPISPTGPAVPAIGVSGGLRLQCLSGNFAGRRFPIEKQVRIGRDPARNDLVYPANAPGVSGVHCVVKVEGGQLWLTDLGSSHGTYLNGRKLTANQASPLNPGDRFYLGSENEMFQITVKGGA